MKRYRPLIALILVVVLGLVGGTFAYFTGSIPVQHEFASGEYKIVVEENFVSPNNWTPGDTNTLMTTVRNESSVPVTVRAKYNEYWIAADGTSLDLKRNGKKIAQFEVNRDMWKRSSDGYYYYDKTLEIGETTTSFIDSVTFNPDFELVEGVDIECTQVQNDDGSTGSRCSSLTSGYGGATYYLEIIIETAQLEENWAPEVATVVMPTDEELSEMIVTNEYSQEIHYGVGLIEEYITDDGLNMAMGMLQVMNLFGNMNGFEYDVKVLWYQFATASRDSVDDEFSPENAEIQWLYYVDEDTFAFVQLMAPELGIDISGAGVGWNEMILDIVDGEIVETGVVVKAEQGPTIPSWIPEKAFDFKHPYFDEIVQVQ